PAGLQGRRGGGRVSALPSLPSRRGFMNQRSKARPRCRRRSRRFRLRRTAALPGRFPDRNIEAVLFRELADRRDRFFLSLFFAGGEDIAGAGDDGPQFAIALLAESLD